MPQWMVTIRNAEDPEVLQRRAAVRPAHLQNVKALAASGRILAGGALLDESGQPIGTAAMVDFPDRDALDTWLRTDPYATAGVWDRFEVVPVSIAVRAP